MCITITAKIADEQIQNVNKSLANLKHPNTLRRSSRYHHHGLDLFDTDGKCLRTIATGSARDCALKARLYLCEVAIAFIETLQAQKEQ